MSPSSSYSHVFSLPAGVEDVFRLFSDPGLLDALTPSWFELEPAPGFPRPLAPGSEITYRLRWRGLPLRWTSRIVDWEPPHLLTYEQVRGPYRAFRHEHRFEAETGGTRVTDRVVFRAPGGRLIERLLVRPDLERIFRHRERAARRILGTRAPGSRVGRCSGPPPGARGAPGTLGAEACDPQADAARGASLMPLTRASSSAIEPPT